MKAIFELVTLSEHGGDGLVLGELLELLAGDVGDHSGLEEPSGIHVGLRVVHRLEALDPGGEE